MRKTWVRSSMATRAISPVRPARSSCSVMCSDMRARDTQCSTVRHRPPGMSTQDASQ